MPRAGSTRCNLKSVSWASSGKSARRPKWLFRPVALLGCKREVPSPLPSSRAARKHTPEAKTPKFCPLGCMKFARNCKMVLLRPIFRFGVSIDWNVSATPFETKNCSSCSSVISSILSGISRRAEHLALIRLQPASIDPLRLPTGARLQQPQRLWRPKREDHLRLCRALAARCNRVR
jgi:hypothetical protein